jgi:hypothetical protein
MTSAPGSQVTPRRGLSRRRHTLFAASAAAILSGLLAGCHIPGTSSGAAGPTLSTITVAAQSGVADAPLYLAQRAGVFRQAGLTVNIQNYDTAKAEISALTNGNVQFAVGDYFDFFYAQDRPSHPGFVVVADGYDAAPSVMEVLTAPGRPDDRHSRAEREAVQPDHALQRGDPGHPVGAGQRRGSGRPRALETAAARPADQCSSAQPGTGHRGYRADHLPGGN